MLWIGLRSGGICKLQGLPGGERIKVQSVEQGEGLPSCIAWHRDRRRDGGDDLNAERSQFHSRGQHIDVNTRNSTSNKVVWVICTGLWSMRSPSPSFPYHGTKKDRRTPIIHEPAAAPFACTATRADFYSARHLTWQFWAPALRPRRCRRDDQLQSARGAALMLSPISSHASRSLHPLVGHRAKATAQGFFPVCICSWPLLLLVPSSCIANSLSKP